MGSSYLPPPEQNVVNVGDEISASALAGLQYASPSGSQVNPFATVSYVTTAIAGLAAPNLSGYAQLSGATFTGKVNLPSSISGSAYLNLAPGFNPSSPSNGDLWTTALGLWTRVNGATHMLATTTFVQSQGYTTTTYVDNAVNASKLRLEGTFSGSFEVPANYNNYILTLDSSDGTNKSVTFNALAAGSSVTFIQGGTDQIVFPTANAYMNKVATEGQYAVVTAHRTQTGWFLEGDLTYTPSGYVLSSSCAYYEGNDALGAFWADYYYSEAIVADGSGGTYSSSTPNANGCWYPQGYCITKGSNYNESTLYWEVYDSNMSVVASSTFAYSYQFDAEFANGDGTSSWSYGISHNAQPGDLISNGQYYDSNYGSYYYYDVFSDGSTGYYVNTYQ